MLIVADTAAGLQVQTHNHLYILGQDRCYSYHERYSAPPVVEWHAPIEVTRL